MANSTVNPSKLRTDVSSLNAPYTYFLVISNKSRHTFFVVFLIISVLSLIGNVSAIYSISRRKYRYIQKTCIISLALSDIVSTTVIAVNNMETFSHPLITWTLGEFLCSFIPMCQFGAMIASSFALVFIAMDRYRNVVHALSKRWNPRLSYCIACAITMWVVSFVISIPMYTFFNRPSVGIFYPDELKLVSAYICVSFKKTEMMIYYILMILVIFLPLLIIFIWFYYNIAVLIWKHRKPLSMIFNKKHKISELENSSSNTKTTKISTENLPNTHLKPAMPKSKDIRVERKIRTFKIIVTLMLVFILCRLPSQLFSLLKLTNEFNGEGIWITNYTFVALNIINCMLNPLLYTFLNQTLSVCMRIKKAINDFTCEICCCCFSNTEFEEFEKGNPFVVENFDQRKTMQEPARSKRNSRVKFEDVKEVQLYSQDTNMLRASSQKKY